MTQDIFRQKPELDERDERAQRAVRAFRAMQPGLSGYARAITGDPAVEVQLSTGIPRTDGKRIYFKPPIELGDLTTHDRSKCDTRDKRTLQQLCPACGIREQVLITIYHEIAHIIYGTFQKVSEKRKLEAMDRAIQEAPGKYSKVIREKWDSLPSYKKQDYLNLSGLISPFLPVLVNCIEDARVDENMFKARKGTKNMFDAYTRSIFENGIEEDDGTITTWKDKPLNSQALIGVFVLACKYEYEGWFSPEVEEALSDSKLRKLVDRVDTLRSAEGSYSLAFPILARLRELGFCKGPEEDDEDQEDSEDESDESDSGQDDAPSEPSESVERGDDDSGESDSDGDPAEGSSEMSEPDQEGEPGESDEQESSGDGEADSSSHSDREDDSGGESSSDPSEDDSDAEESDLEDDSSRDEADNKEVSSDGSDEQAVPDAEASGTEQVDDGAPEEDGVEDEADTDGTESDAQEGSDGGEDREEEGSDDSTGAGSPREGNGDSDEQEEQDFELDSDDRSTDDSDPPEENGEDEEEVEIVDTGADEGKGGIQVDDPNYGTPEEALEDLQQFSQHEEKPEIVPTEDDQKALDKAIVQAEYFEKPSANVVGVREHKYGQPVIEGRYNMSVAWRGQDLSPAYRNRNRKSLLQFGIGVDLTVPEQVLGPALLEMRRALSDNARASFERHLSSGKINKRVLGKRAWAGDPRLFQKKRLPGKKSYAVLIGIDISGSTVGVNIALAKRAAMAQAELCHRIGVDFAIYAHTAMGAATGDGTVASDLYLDVYEIKSFSDAWSDGAKEAFSMIGSAAENLDGHGIEYYRKMIERHPATDKIILYYSDGKMPAANYTEELEILQREIQYCKAKRITLAGVGIRTDSPKRHGLSTVRVNNDSDIRRVVQHLESELLHNR